MWRVRRHWESSAGLRLRGWCRRAASRGHFASPGALEGWDLIWFRIICQAHVRVIFGSIIGSYRTVKKSNKKVCYFSLLTGSLVQSVTLVFKETKYDWILLRVQSSFIQNRQYKTDKQWEYFSPLGFREPGMVSHHGFVWLLPDWVRAPYVTTITKLASACVA